MAPSPRTSFGLATHRQRAVLFGGAHRSLPSVAARAGGNTLLQPSRSLVRTAFCPVFMFREWHKHDMQKPLMQCAPMNASKHVHCCRLCAIPGAGITDRAGAGDKLYSELHDELYQFSFTSRRWFPLALRARRGAAAQARFHMWNTVELPQVAWCI